MKLYLIDGCPFAHRAAIALAEKGIAFEPVVYTASARPPALDAVSPFAKSPTLFDGADAVYESAVVLEYLEDKFPARPLLPVSAKGRADVRLVIARVNDELGSKLGAIAGAALRPSPDPAKIAEAGEAFVAALDPWNTRLANKTFLVEEQLSLADITLYTIFPAVARMAGVTIPERLPHLRAWHDRIASRATAPFPTKAA